ncbi:MAG: YjbQ family protein [Thermodesulfatator sp.]|nr:MAG: YjbQ family protein [Thermodesulfatator sp.]
MEVIEVVTTNRTELIDITSDVQRILDSVKLQSGIVFIYCPHTTGAITINEGADPAVRKDIINVLNDIIPWNFDYKHMEGNSPAHIKTTLVGPSVSVIVEDQRLCLGTWQRIFFCEFDGPRRRKVWLKALKS